MKNIKLKRWDKVEIEWFDCVSDIAHPWVLLSEVIDVNYHEQMLHQTIGYFIKQEKDFILICMAHKKDTPGGDETYVAIPDCIPIGCIQKITKLK